VADSLSFRAADLNERGPRYKWLRLIENFFGKLKEIADVPAVAGNGWNRPDFVEKVACRGDALLIHFSQ
jgi:hypothetical protein